MATNNRNELDINHYITTAEEIEQTNEQLYDYLSYDTQTSTIQTTEEVSTDYETDDGDYSLQPHYTEQTNYEMKSHNDSVLKQDTSKVYQAIDMPLIEKQESESVAEYTKINLSARMKVVLASFIIIVTSLMFATIWNFVLVSKINATMAQNQSIVSDLKVSIKDLTDEYDLLGDEETIKNIAKSENFVEADDTNSVEISLDDMFTEQTVEDVPSNWFNDVCNFMTSLFS